MKLAVWINVYDCPYYNDWKQGIASQIDMDFEIYYNIIDACNHADCVLCLDIDDIPEPALVHIAKINAREHDVTAFAMKMVNEDNEVIGRFGKMVDVNAYNVWGFGNTVWKSEILAGCVPIDFSSDTPDWDTVKRSGAHLHFEHLPLIRYRRYGGQSNLVKLGDCYVWK